MLYEAVAFGFDMICQDQISRFKIGGQQSSGSVRDGEREGATRFDRIYLKLIFDRMNDGSP